MIFEGDAMDFVKIRTSTDKKGQTTVYPDFRVIKSKDLMVRGKSFYAIWDEEIGVWSTDEYEVARLVDKEIYNYISENDLNNANGRFMESYSGKSWREFKDYVSKLSNNSHQLDEKLTFSNTKVTKEDYISKRLPYSLEEGSIEAYDELIGTLYSDDERRKLEWAIGSIISGDSRSIQKFIVLYGEAGTGKSTVLNIIQKLFTGYYTTFEAKELTSRSNAFATEVFRENPLVAIQHDGDLSRIEDNSKLNSIVSHEEMTVNEKYKSSYTARINCFLFMATNKPVKITDGRSGVIRRLIDVSPSGNKVGVRRYNQLMSQIDFELGAIAYHCLKVYEEMGKNYYNSYRPMEMMYKTDYFYNFVEDMYYDYKQSDGTSLKEAYQDFKLYCLETGIDVKLPMYKFREELKNYFKEYHQRLFIDGENKYSYFSGFLTEKFKKFKEDQDKEENWLELNYTTSIFDETEGSRKAQYAKEDGSPTDYWSNVKTTLSDLNTKELHYVRLPSNYIVIDFDLRDGQDKTKSSRKNIEAASAWPKTYAEFSKSGGGIHLHYIYNGDVSQLAKEYSDGIEIKTFTGNAALRRKLTKCNNISIATLKGGLPLKEKRRKNVVDSEVIKSELGLRKLIERNLRKEIHPGTKPSIDFINKILDDAYKNGLHYDISDMRPAILAFANNSTNQSEYCVKVVANMKFFSDEPSAAVPSKSDEIIFFDVEVFPNLFLVNYKMRGKKYKVIRLINPTSKDIEKLLKYRLVGFNNRRYDNHILYARLLGFDNYKLFLQSQRIVGGSKNALFREAYNLSYADIYEFSSKKQSLKKFEIELGIHHQELGLKWDEPVPEELWEKVAEYCDNDVIATEAVFEDRYQDFVARQILADRSGLTVNDTTQQHTAKIIFGEDQKPQDKFVYTDLSEMFKGYTFSNGKSIYRGEEVGEGGYVYAEPGMYGNVALLDIASMHPTSLIEMNMFGPYTKNFKELLDVRLAIKHKDYGSAKKMMGGAFEKYLSSEDQANSLSYALKIVINMVYGFTMQKYENKFKDQRNVDNIVAKRGALFMVDLKHAVQEKGFTVAHIKTDSIKIPDATPEIIDFVCEFGKKYGYTFEHEATYDKMCLVNDAVYIARIKDGRDAGRWTATGAEFAHPYIFKRLFSGEKIVFEDMCETKSVTSSLYLDMNEELKEDEHNYIFVGRVGRFCPISEGKGGGILYREKDGKYYAVTGTKGYRWLESEMVKNLKKEKDIDTSYYEKLVDDAVAHLSEFGDFQWLVSEEQYNGYMPFENFMNKPEELPWD